MHRLHMAAVLGYRVVHSVGQALLLELAVGGENMGAWVCEKSRLTV